MVQHRLCPPPARGPTAFFVQCAPRSQGALCLFGPAVSCECCCLERSRVASLNEREAEPWKRAQSESCWLSLREDSSSLLLFRTASSSMTLLLRRDT
eukprot:3015567-Rhodomonas_salina.3